MSNQDIVYNLKAFWRAKYARQCIKHFQANQLRPYLHTLPSLAHAHSDLHHKLTKPSLHPIASPIPILKPQASSQSSPPSLRRDLAFPGTGSNAQIAEDPSKITVGILGAGAAGLYAAMILQDLGIKYEILEGSERAGGRVRTQGWKKPLELLCKLISDLIPFNMLTSLSCFQDVGAMRYPKIGVMWRIFDLLENRLDLKDKLVECVMKSENQVIEYNRQRIQQKAFDEKPLSADVFRDSCENNGLVPKAYVDAGVEYWLGECFGPFERLLMQDWEKGWAKLMEYDKYSTRGFMVTAFDDKDENGNTFLKKDAYPDAVINWMERSDIGTGLFDMAFAELVMDDLQLPNSPAVKYGAVPFQDDGSKWFCVAGGSEVFIQEMIKLLDKRVQYNKPVIKIAPTGNEKPMSVTCSPGDSTDFDYVISTIPLPALRFVDLDLCNLSYAQLEGMRTLRYDSSCKVGMKFKSRWWQNLPSGPIFGGLTKSDRVFRMAVFPSYGIQDENADAVMIASYTWSQDAIRVGGLLHGRHSAAEKFLIEDMLKDLATLHDVTVEFLKQELEDWHAYDWSADPFSLGGFAFFGAGQYKNISPAFGQGAAGGRLLFAGEPLDAQHAWVEGALESGYSAVQRMLEGAGLTELVQKLEDNWGNPHLREEERKEIKEIMWLQEVLGTVFSTTNDPDSIRETLEMIGVKPDMFGFSDG